MCQCAGVCEYLPGFVGFGSVCYHCLAIRPRIAVKPSSFPCMATTVCTRGTQETIDRKRFFQFDAAHVFALAIYIAPVE
eukprot:3417861-Amphidinium_carterae.1